MPSATSSEDIGSLELKIHKLSEGINQLQGPKELQATAESLQRLDGVFDRSFEAAIRSFAEALTALAQLPKTLDMVSMEIPKDLTVKKDAYHKAKKEFEGLQDKALKAKTEDAHTEEALKLAEQTYEVSTKDYFEAMKAAVKAIKASTATNIQKESEGLMDAIGSAIRSLKAVKVEAAHEENEATAIIDPNSVTAVHTYRSGEEGHLEFKRGDHITILEREGAGLEDGWVKGSVNGRIGVFPLQYVAQSPAPSSPSTPTEHMDVDAPAPIKNTLKRTAFSYLPPGGLQPGDIPVLKKREPTSPTQEPGDEAASSVAVAAACGTCGCNDYSQNVFKPGHCNNCFHKH